MDFTEIFILFLGVILVTIVLKNFENTTYMYAFKPLREQFQDASRFRAANVNNGPDSYLLLDDTLKGYPANTIAKGPTSQQCFQVDMRRDIDRAGSYNQRTNNFKHMYPDTCNSLNHDLVLDFYRPCA
jgi:hypothetical protein